MDQTPNQSAASAADRSARGRRSRRGAVPTWLRIALLGVVIVIVPVAVYVFFYQAGRVENATIRNFRALDAAAGRVASVLANLPNVVSNHSFGVSCAMLKVVHERITGIPDETEFAHDCAMEPKREGNRMKDADEDELLAALSTWDRHLSHLRDRNGNPNQSTARLKEELTYEIVEFVLTSVPPEKGLEPWRELRSLLKDYRRSYNEAEAATTTLVTVNPLPLSPTIEHLEFLAKLCGNEKCSTDSQSFSNLLERTGQDRCGQPTRFVESGAGMVAEFTDCRPFRARSPLLYEALRQRLGIEDRDVPPVILALDLFGARSVAELAPMLTQAAGHLAQFFDHYLIAHGDGQILVELETANDLVAGTDAHRTAAHAFSNHVDISDLLSQSHPPNDPFLSLGAERRPAAASTPGRHSVLRSLNVGGVDLRVFIHPFIVNNIESSGAGNTTGETATSDRVLYMVGVVGADDLRSEAIRLRLAWVVMATLAVLTVLTLFPTLRFRTAGPRLMLRPATLTAIAVIPVVGVVFYVVLALGIVTNRVDEHALDDAVEVIARQMKHSFNMEVNERIHHLREFARKYEPPSDRSTTPGSGGDLKDHFYCREPAGSREANDGPTAGVEIPPYDFASLIGEQGRPHYCDNKRSLRSAKHDLQFRDYFQRPSEGRLWRPDDTDDADDADDTGRIPYFMERIDSIVQGEVATVVAICSDRPAPDDTDDRCGVASAGIRFESLARTVPPHFGFAVIDRTDGRTLFHSDERRAMATNFIKDVGADSRLLSQLHAGADGTIGLVYDGIPIRARVTFLREEMPWTLIVYRDHEIEDQLLLVTSSLALFCTFLAAVLVALFVGLSVITHRLRTPSRTTFSTLFTHVLHAGSTARARAGVAATAGLAALVAGLSHWWSFPLWHVVPVVAAVSFAAAPILLGWKMFRSIAEEQAVDPAKIKPAVVVGVVVIGLAIIPTSTWFLYHRAQLSTGLKYYVAKRVDESTELKQESYRRMARDYEQTRDSAAIWEEPAFWIPDASTYGWKPPRISAETEPGGWTFDLLRPLVAPSTLANNLMVHRTVADPSGGVGSPRAVFEAILESADNRATLADDPRRAPHSSDSESPYQGWWLIRTLLVAAMLLLGLVLLALVIAWSVHAAVRGRPRCIATTKMLQAGRDDEETYAQASAPHEPLRIMALHRNSREREDFEAKFRNRLAKRRRANWIGENITWEPHEWDPGAVSGSADSRILHVVDDLESILTDEKRNLALLDELERIGAKRASVLIWTRIVPGYRLSERAGRTGGHSFNEDRFARWSRLLGGFLMQTVFETEDETKKKFEEQLANTERYCPEVVSAMEEEVLANPELRDLAARVVEETSTPHGERSSQERRSGQEQREVAMGQFRAHAEGYFNMLWAQSTFDERLQLHTLAHGGLANREQTAVLSSLASRGLVNLDGIVRLRSKAFGEFIVQDLTHNELVAWQKKGQGNAWKAIWPPLAIGAALALVFFFQTNPEMLSAILAIMAAILPFTLSLLRGTPNVAQGSSE